MRDWLRRVAADPGYLARCREFAAADELPAAPGWDWEGEEWTPDREVSASPVRLARADFAWVARLGDDVTGTA